VGFEQTATSERELRDIRHMASALPQVEMTTIVNASGDSVFMTSMLPMPKVNLAEREFFQAHRAGADLVIGRTIRTQATGQLSFTVSKRVAGSGDRFAGVVAAVTPLSYFAGLYDSLNLGPDGTIGLVRDDGAVVAQHPWRDEYLESSVASSDLFRIQLPKAASGSYRALSPVDGIERFASYRKLEGYPLVVVAAIGIDDAMAHWWTEALGIGGIAAFFLIILWGLTGFAMRAIRREEDARQRCIVAQSGLQQAIDDRDLLFAESHHRIKNNLQSVASLLGMMASRAEGRARHDLKRAADRLRPMSLVHEMLYRSGEIRRVDIPSYLEELCSKLAEGYDAADRGIALEVEAAPLSLDVKIATPLGLIVTELVSNALKHAFPEGRIGTVRVAMDTQRLTVRDDGVGIPSQSARGRGFGFHLADGLAEQIGAQMSVDCNEGCTVVVALPEGLDQPITAGYGQVLGCR
jgi:two-component system, sensor histidine kinase PdtaS